MEKPKTDVTTDIKTNIPPHARTERRLDIEMARIDKYSHFTDELK